MTVVHGRFVKFAQSAVLAVATTLLVALLPALPGAAASQYQVTDLGTLGGASSEVNGMNHKGQIVGRAQDRSGDRFAFLWSNGRMRKLTCGDGYAAESAAFDVNSRGLVVGQCEDFPAMWVRGKVTWLPDGWGGYYGEARAINGAATVVGYTDDEDDDSRAHVWARPEYDFLLLDPAGTDEDGLGWSVANDVNGGGQVVGTSSVAAPASIHRGFESRATMWEGDRVRVLEALPGFGSSEARSVNVGGTVVGTSSGVDDAGAYVSRATRWDASGAHDLGTLPGGTSSEAWAVNDHGHVVGASDSVNGRRATLWRDGRVIDLGVLPGGSLSTATALDNHGWIAGGSRDAKGRYRAVLWRPGT